MLTIFSPSMTIAWFDSVRPVLTSSTLPAWTMTRFGCCANNCDRQRHATKILRMAILISFSFLRIMNHEGHEGTRRTFASIPSCSLLAFVVNLFTSPFSIQSPRLSGVSDIKNQKQKQHWQVIKFSPEISPNWNVVPGLPPGGKRQAKHVKH